MSTDTGTGGSAGTGSGGSGRGGGRVIRAGRRTVTVSRPDKILFPDDGITKGELAVHYRSVAGRAVPRLRGRPLMMERYPDGIGDDGHPLRPLMQKNAPDHFPGWVRRSVQAKEGGKVTHVLCDDAATLVYLADQASVTQHRWLSRADRPDHPDLLVVDLDPPPDGGASFDDVRWAARQVCELWDELKLPARLMTTGSRGLHVITPLDAKAAFDSVRDFAHAAAGLLARRHPDRLTTEVRKAAREGRIYLDVQRNAYAQTAVAPYCVRARPGAPVATPISREELEDPELTADRWTLRTFQERLSAPDPWSEAHWRGRSLRAARKRLDALTE
ncbi:non-homologous end-joining DNA ligase [Streptomyces sp. MST-110588]|uniref:non-homologous end-joining DNA ligase n=1 Tax=Streptomyces sp. MST-110588 TaxID=2833628 RepID=UPI001F5D275D|nr:non-homologous end-joining DNA ligase [Streptomyces sp. MST-110588]UNO41088.1 non-homologous end-joining DNA ligase [Streptomyces sp. MST-110588]